MTIALLIFGTGAHARKVHHAALSAGCAIVGFADEAATASSPVPGVPLLDLAAVAALPPATAVFVAIGQADVRQRLMDGFAARGRPLPALVHRHTSVAPDALLEPGVLVAAGAVIESGARVGRGAIVDVGVMIDHDVVVAPFSHLLPGQVCGAGTHWPAGT